jgi:mRNA interferase MazF
MLTSGDVVDLDLGMPIGREAGFAHPAVVVTAQELLDQRPTVVQVVPLTSTIRGYRAEVVIDGSDSGLDHPSSAQCQHLRSVSTARILRRRGAVGPVDLVQIREVLGLLLDIPG